MLYLNLSVRGYPQGLRVGQDPRAPILSIDGGFEKVSLKSISFKVYSFSGCSTCSSERRDGVCHIIHTVSVHVFCI